MLTKIALQTVEINKNDDQNLAATPRDSPAVRAARFMACHPYKFFFGTLGLTLAISVLAGSAGLEVSLDSKGWRSRNTLIAQREMQNEIVVRFKDELFEGKCFKSLASQSSVAQSTFRLVLVNYISKFETEILIIFLFLDAGFHSSFI